MIPRRLLLVSLIADRLWTGMGRWTHEMAEALRHSNHKVTTWFASDFPISAAIGRWAVLSFPIALAYAIFRERRRFDAVVVHEPAGLWYSILQRHSTSLPPILAMCHNVESHCFVTMRDHTQMGLASVPVLSQIRSPLFRHWQSDGSIRFANHVICLSTVDREYIRNRLGVPDSKVTQLINGTSPEDFVNRAPVGTSVLWVGGWLDHKGKRVLPVLWRDVRANIPAATLTIVGTGVSGDDVLACFASVDRESITVLPRVDSRDEMRSLYSTHAVFIMTSLTEGSPLALLEALAAGLPCVATSVGGIPDIISSNESGLLYRPDDASTGAQHVIDLLSDPLRASELGEVGRARAAKLTWAAAASTLMCAVEEVLSMRAEVHDEG
jgi:glycosyltransferase involved in cell wall biosynthesis